MSKKAIFPGSFDPITKGHVSVIKRALSIFDSIIIAIGKNSSKGYYFSLDQRIDMIKAVFKDEPKVTVISYQGLTVDFMKENNIQYILRGLRTSTDFEYERTIAQMNNAMEKDIETFFLLTTPELSVISSTVVREILKNNGNIEPFVPNEIIKLIK